MTEAPDYLPKEVLHALRNGIKIDTIDIPEECSEEDAAVVLSWFNDLMADAIENI